MPAFLSTEARGVAAPRVLVREECRERWGHYACDGRRPIREIIKVQSPCRPLQTVTLLIYQKRTSPLPRNGLQEFPNFDFSEVEYDDDVFYTEDEREPEEHCRDRAVQFLEWLNKRPEKCIAVVTHSSFLRHLFMQFGGDKSGADKDSLQRLAGNCELRSVVMCSHGVKDAATLRPMTPSNQSSTVDMGELDEAPAAGDA